MRSTRRRFLQLAGLTGSTALLGCDAATDSLANLILPQEGADFRPPSGTSIDLISHAINRLTFGARPGDYQRIASLGVEQFIEQQLAPDSIDDRRCQWRIAELEELHEPTPELYEHHPELLLHQMTRGKLLRATYSKRQLLDIMVDFWSDHFNIVSSKGDCRWLKVADDREVIRKHALGNFRNLVRASAVSPAMLIYLDGHDNKVEHPGDRPNENYARELLELHTLGVHGGYTQQDVMEVARCLSGWTYGHYPLKYRQAQVRFDPARHDDGEKRVLGNVIASGGGERDLDAVLDIVCSHSSTAKYLATKLCRRFIDDPPPQPAVTAVATELTRSGGDIRATLHALFSSDEFQASRGNLFKRPQHFIVSSLRAVDARSDCGRPVIDALQRMGHAPFQYPTPDGFPLDAQPWLASLLWRWNFAIALESQQIKGTSIDKVALANNLGAAQGAAAHLLGRAPTSLEQQCIERSASPLALLLASPAFQRF